MEHIEHVLKNLTHGVYVVGVAEGNVKHAFTASWIMQASFSPILLAISINPKHASYSLLKQGKVCSVNVLSQQQIDLAAHFGTSGLVDKMSVGQWTTAITGAPILEQSLAYFDCKVSHETDAGDHRVVICEVMGAKLLHKGKPMLYAETGQLDNSAALYHNS